MIEEHEAPPIPAPEEKTVWEGTPSQWTQFGNHLGWGLVLVALAVVGVWLRLGGCGFLGSWGPPIGLGVLALTVVPLFVILRAYLVTRTTKYKLTSQRILSTIGVFSRRTDNLELYRVDDLNVLQPFFLRLVGLSNIVVVSSDRTTAELTLAGIRDANALRDTMRKHIEECRDRKRTRVIDGDLLD
ncbi:MAG: PH domain-containing protein [Deltaproteobacteria bacterium]|nr:PH domain-containing protein [Deltaproteobacteria bacterium]